MSLGIEPFGLVVTKIEFQLAISNIAQKSDCFEPNLESFSETFCPIVQQHWL